MRPQLGLSSAAGWKQVPPQVVFLQSRPDSSCLQNYHIENTRSQRTVDIITFLPRLPRFILQDVRNSLTHNLICKDKATLSPSSKSTGRCCVSNVLSPGRLTAGRHLLLQLPEIFIRLMNIQLPPVLFAFLDSMLLKGKTSVFYLIRNH